MALVEGSKGYLNCVLFNIWLEVADLLHSVQAGSHNIFMLMPKLDSNTVTTGHVSAI
jgi:hypothetical protein